MGREDSARDPFDPQQNAKFDLEGLFRAHSRKMKLEIRTVVPASLVSFNSATNRAIVQLEILPRVRVDDPTRQPTAALIPAAPPLKNEATLAPIPIGAPTGIPVSWPSGAMGRLTFPLTPGDQGLLLVADRALEDWLLQGIPGPAPFAATHNLKDSVFLPCQLSATKPFVPPIDAAAVVLDGPQVKIGALATEGAVKAESLVMALVNAVNSAPVGAMDGGATFKAALAINLAAILTQIRALKTLVE